MANSKTSSTKVTTTKSTSKATLAPKTSTSKAVPEKSANKTEEQETIDYLRKENMELRNELQAIKDLCKNEKSVFNWSCNNYKNIENGSTLETVWTRLLDQEADINFSHDIQPCHFAELYYQEDLLKTPVSLLKRNLYSDVIHAREVAKGIK